MSQEEEKLIEKFKEEFKIIFAKHSSIIPKNFYKILEYQLFAIYRAGKLAGFEVCEKIIPELPTTKPNYEKGECETCEELFRNCTCGFRYEVINEIKSLIEEEKKKL